MEIPSAAYGATVEEGKLYFFKSDCPIGVKDHIHVCIKRGETILLFAACSSQIEKARRRAEILNYDLNTYPVFTANDENLFTKDQTFIDCNNPIEISLNDFSDLIKEDKVYEMKGHFDNPSLTLIFQGVKLSTVVENRIKEML